MTSKQRYPHYGCLPLKTGDRLTRALPNSLKRIN